MQLVLSNNRVIAHGENFLSMGGVVINTVTGAKYDNATVAECEGCPTDIDKVGYEYKGGVFVPCAPFPGLGNNNGYFMEVCESCATPRNSGIPIRAIKFDKIASVIVSSSTKVSVEETTDVPISAETLLQYESLRYVIKKGSYIDFSNTVPAAFSQSTVSLYFGGPTGPELFAVNAVCDGSTMPNNFVFTFDEDYKIPETFSVGKSGNEFIIRNSGTSYTGNVIVTSDLSGDRAAAGIFCLKVYMGSSSAPVNVNLNLEIHGRKLL